MNADTEALKALVALARSYYETDEPAAFEVANAAVLALGALERMLASQTQTADELPFMPTTNAAKPTEHMVDEALDGFNTMPATEGLRAQVEHAVERAMWACPVFAPLSKSVWALVDKWRDESGRTGIHSVLQFALMNHAIELDEALAAVPVASQMGEPVPVAEVFISERTVDLCPMPITRRLREILGDGIHPLYAAPAAGMDADGKSK